MTTREVAEALGVTPERVKQVARELGYEMKNGVISTWNEEQCAAISIRLGSPMKTGPKEADPQINLQESSVLENPVVSKLVATFDGREKVLAAVVENMDMNQKVKAAMTLTMQCIAELNAKIERQQIELDQAHHWASVKRIKLLNPKLDERRAWRPLVAWMNARDAPQGYRRRELRHGSCLSCGGVARGLS